MKYIVYLTVNKINGKIYVGVHKTRTPHQFDGYIGNGLTVGNRKFDACTPFRRAIKKYGMDSFTRHTLMVFENSQEAYDIEEKIVTMEFVKSHKSYNVALGGHSGAKHSTVLAFRYDMTTGNFVGGYGSITEAAEDLNISHTIIGNCIRLKNSAKSAGGYYWNSEKLSNYTPPAYPKIERAYKPSITEKRARVSFTTIEEGTEVFKYELGTGKFIEAYSSINSAMKSLKKGDALSRRVKECLVGNRKRAYGFAWSMEKVDVLKGVISINYPAVEVNQYDSSTGTYIATYESAKHAATSLGKSIRGNITSCLTGKRRTAGGFKWSTSRENKIVI